MSNDLSTMTVAALSHGLAARRFSPVDVVDASLARIAALEPKLQAFVQVHAAEAKLAAEASAACTGRAAISTLIPNSSRR